MTTGTSMRHALVVCLAAVLTSAGGGTAPAEVVLRAADAGVKVGAWTVVADTTAAGGTRLTHPNAGAPKLLAPLASPAHYVELTFTADAAIPYRLWLRGKAQSNAYENDSVYVQFSDSTSSGGAPAWRIGTTSATPVTIEDCTSCGLSGWGWQDNAIGAGVLGPPVYFEKSGSHTIRIQTREDGLSIDQIVLSPATYLNRAPGLTKNDATILTGGTPSSAPLVREPYLQQVSDHSAIIVWVSREPGPASARVGGRDFVAATTLYPPSQTADYYQHKATITGLSPATTYAYDIFVGGTDVNARADQFRTAPALGSGAVSFVIFSDSGTGSTQQKALAALMAGDPFDLMLHAGDIAYGNTGGTGDASHATFQSWFFDIYRDSLRRKPIFPSMGNHDARLTNVWGQAYLDVFVLPEEAGAGAYSDHAERYYSFDYGPVHFIALDTERAFQDPARRAAQVAWLEADLASTTQPWKLAFFHRAPYSSGAGHGSDLAVRATFAPIFERYGVQIALSGHEHDYERAVPRREGSDLSRRAVLNIVSGGGGAPLYDAGISAWTARSLRVHHYLRGSISGCVATFEAIDTTGLVFDRYVFDRCAQATDSTAPTVTFTNPAAGASVSGLVSVEATADDDVRVEKVDLWIDGRLHALDLTAPYRFTWDAATVAAGAHTLELRAYDIDGKRAVQTRTINVAAAGGSAPDVVLYAADAHIIGSAWGVVADSTAAGGLRLANPNAHAAKPPGPLASPASYFELTFTAQGGIPYRLWMRGKAQSNRFENDSVYVQFSDSMTADAVPISRIASTSAFTVTIEDCGGCGLSNWGWQDTAIGTGILGPAVYFSRTGQHTIRIQVREDGLSIDQIVLSPGTYLTRSPGRVKDDGTILPR